MKTRITDPIDKHTLVLRLSVNIYRMTDEQIRRLLSLLDPDTDRDPDAAPPNGSPSFSQQDAVLQRQMMIARLFVLIQQMETQALLACLNAFAHPDSRWSREYPRMDCHVLVDFAVQGKAYRGYLRDISAGGMFIVTPERFQIGQEISMCFTLDESNPSLSFKIAGKVQRRFTDGIGVVYSTITHDQQNAINTLVDNTIGV